MKKSLLLLLLVVAGFTANAQQFLNRIPTVNTGITGCINSVTAYLKVSGHSDLSHPLPKGSSFELLNLSSVKDNDALNTLKIKVTYDAGGGSSTGLIGFVYPSGTSLTDYFNYTTSKVTIDFKNLVPTTNPGFIGASTYEGLTLRMNDFDDNSPNLNDGTKLELLSTKMAKTIDCTELYLAKVKVVDGPHAGKVGYVYASLTTFTADYTNATIGAAGSSVSTPATSTDNGGSWDIPDYPTERTGISGTVDIEAGAYAYEDGSDWTSEVKVPLNATFILLNKKVFHDALMDDYYIKVKVTNDPAGTYTGKVMWITILDTTLNSRFNQDDTEPTVN